MIIEIDEVVALNNQILYELEMEIDEDKLNLAQSFIISQLLKDIPEIRDVIYDKINNNWHFSKENKYSFLRRNL